MSIERQRSKVRLRPVTARSLLAKQGKEAAYRLTVILKQMDALLAASTDATPATDESRAAEEIRLERYLVKACHVSGLIDALNIQAEPMLGHGSKLAGQGSGVQRHF